MFIHSSISSGVTCETTVNKVCCQGLHWLQIMPYLVSLKPVNSKFNSSIIFILDSVIVIMSKKYILSSSKNWDMHGIDMYQVIPAVTTMCFGPLTYKYWCTHTTRLLNKQYCIYKPPVLSNPAVHEQRQHHLSPTCTSRYCMVSAQTAKLIKHE